MPELNIFISCKKSNEYMNIIEVQFGKDYL